MNRHTIPITNGDQLKQRVSAALANNPKITPGELVKQTGLPMGLAIASVQAGKAVC